MEIKTTPSNITSINSYRKSETPKPALKICKSESAIQPAGVVDFNLMSSFYPNVSKRDERELYGYYKKEGYDITRFQVKTALAKYYKDAVELKPVFNRADKVIKEFEDKISKLDFSSIKNITNIYKIKDEIAKEQESDWFFDYVPSRESREIMKNIARMYIDIINKNHPEYEIEIADDGTDSPTNAMMQISIQKGDDVLLLFYEDFIESMQKGKLSQNTNIILSTPKENEYYYLYEGGEGLLDKVDKRNNETVGIIARDCYDENDRPTFYLDDCDASGPTYYALAETITKPEENNSIELDDVEGLDEELKEHIIKSIKEDILVERFYNKYGLAFILSCIRNGEFNMKIAQTMAILKDTGNCYLKGGISQVYINDIVNSIEDDNCNVDEYLSNIAQEFLSKELATGENHHDTIIEVLSYIKNNLNLDTLALGENLSDEFFSFNEVKMIIDLLNSSPKKDQKRIISKLNSLAKEYDVAKEYRPQMSLYQALIYELNRKN